MKHNYRSGFLMPLHPITNFEIQIQNEPKFNVNLV